MFIRQMSYLVALRARKALFARGEKCSVTQSTLSAGLKALERELDMRLVIREPRFMGLTPEVSASSNGHRRSSRTTKA